MRPWGIVAGFALAMAASLAAQSNPRFETVAIRPANPAEMGNGSFHGMGAVDPSRWRVQALTVQPLVATAYNIPWTAYDRVVGLPGWAVKTTYDIDAVLPPHARRAQIPLMVRAMLVERFKLVAHIEDRPMRAATLRLAKGGAKLTPDPACQRPDLPVNARLAGSGRGAVASAAASGCGEASRSLKNGVVEIRFHGMSMAQLADDVAYPNLPVMDQTGLKGTFDFSVHFPDVPSTNPQRQEEQAFRAQLGLRLDRTRAARLPVPVVVVDHIEPPAPN